jgi:hypothetical protein
VLLAENSDFQRQALHQLWLIDPNHSRDAITDSLMAHPREWQLHAIDPWARSAFGALVLLELMGDPDADEALRTKATDILSDSQFKGIAEMATARAPAGAQ